MSLTLYQIEEPISKIKPDDEDGRFHTRLALVDSKQRVLEDINFRNEIDLVGIHRQLNPLKKVNRKGNVLFPHITKTEEQMREIWTHAAGAMHEINAAELEFDDTKQPDSINCRAGVIAVLKSIGLEFQQIAEGTEAGTQANLWETYISSKYDTLDANDL